jgi:hypothetical protein
VIDAWSPTTTSVVFGGLCGAVVGWIATVVGASFVLWTAVGGGLVGGSLASLAPDTKDAVVDRRGHLVVGGLAVLLPTAVAGHAQLVGDPVPGATPATFVLLTGLFFALAGEGQLADRRVADGTVLARADVSTPRTQQVLLHTVGSALVLYGLSLTFGDEIDLSVLLVGAVTSAVLTGNDDRELIVLEEGLVVGRSDGTGGTLRPWWTINAVTADEGTIWLRQSLPPVPRRRVATSEAAARAFADAARRARRRG